MSGRLRLHARVRGAPGGIFAVAAAVALAACTGAPSVPTPQLSQAPTPPAAQIASTVPKGGGIYKVGAPYRVAGRWYVPREENNYEESGVASWYGSPFHGRRTANGEIYDMHSLSAGHRTLPMPSYAYVTNLDNGRTVLVRINDRGPYVKNRLIDLSLRAARELGFDGHGTARVKVKYAGPAPLDGNDVAERQHLATQPWYRPDVAANSSGWTTGTIAKAEPVADASPAEGFSPQWSVMGYRRELAGGKTAPSPDTRASLGGPERSRLVIGPFGSLSEAERMRNEVESLGPTSIEGTNEGSGSVFRVVVGPLPASAIEAAREMAGFAGTEAR
jgi:rare lipoprotein A